MSYLVLARKYRPRTFSEVTGQEVVTGTLRGAIDEGRVAHAYLFCGPRGTGKTTTARLFAKALNCEQGPTADPCGTCDRCLAADAGNEADVIEIDAASHTGVDNVRDLRDRAGYAPMSARHKIYIIDEVHMLSKAAFNALLKTLEEPPPHVKFLFATTEPHKVLDTILSRCQVLKLSALSEEDIARRLDEVFALEGIQAEPGVSAAIARRARGGMRDALSLADQLLALVGDSPTVEDTSRLSAGIDREGLERLVAALAAADRPAVLGELAEVGGGESELIEALLLHLRGCLLVAHCGQDTPLTDGEPEERESMRRTAEALGADRLELWMEELLHAREQIRLLPGQARHALELCLLRLARPEAQVPVAELAERLLALEGRLAAGGVALAPPPSAAPAPRADTPPQPQAQEPPREVPRPSPAPAAQAAPARKRSSFEGTVRSSQTEAWSRFLEELQGRAAALAEVIQGQGRLVDLGQEVAVVRFDRLRQADRPLIEDARNQRLCSQVLAKLLGRPMEVRFEDGASVRPGAEDEFTRKVAETFNGRVED